MTLTWIYSRLSRALGDPDDPELLARHRATLVRLAEGDGVTVPETHVRMEIGSGESIAQRPVFAATLREWEALPAGCGGAVYTMEPSRLSRGSNQERGRILDALIRAQIIVRTPERTYNPANPSDELTWSLIQSVDRNEVQRYKARRDLALAEMTRRGEITNGTVPFGYRWIKSPGQQAGQKVPGRIVAHPDEFPLLQALCREVRSVSIGRLALTYGIDPSTLHDLLHNPVICGFPAAGRHGPREKWVWPDAPGDYPAAISRAEWEEIQVLLAERSVRRLKTCMVEAGWCRSVVQFRNHRGPVKLASVHARGGNVPSYQRDREGRPALYVERAPVHQAALAALAGLFATPEALLRGLADLEEERRRLEPCRSGVQPLRRDLARERERLVNLRHDAADPDLDPEDRHSLLAAQEQVKRKIEQLKRALDLAARPDLSLPDLSGLAPLLAALAGDFPRVWEELAGEEKEEVTRILLKEIPVTVIERRPGQRFERMIGQPVYPEWLPGKECFGE